MGDRANIRFKQTAGSIYLYGHWAGKELAITARKAFIKCRSRWDDDNYATRYIVGQCMKGQLEELTGFGLSTSRTDNERDVLEFDFTENKVRLKSGALWHEDGTEWEDKAKTLKEWTFEEFAKPDAAAVHVAAD